VVKLDLTSVDGNVSNTDNMVCTSTSLEDQTVNVGVVSVRLCVFACGRVADVDEMPFELRNVAIERDRCFSDEFEIIDFLGRYK